MEQITQSYNLYLNGQLKNALSKDEQKKYLELSAQGSYEAKQKIKDAINSTDYILSLEDSIPTNLEDYTILLGETIPSTDISVEEQYEKKERDLIIRKVINGLENKESLIIKKLFGIGYQRKTQMEIAAEIGISQAQVSRLYKIAFKKLKYILINNLEEDFRIESVNKLTRNF